MTGRSGGDEGGVGGGAKRDAAGERGARRGRDGEGAQRSRRRGKEAAGVPRAEGQAGKGHGLRGGGQRVTPRTGPPRTEGGVPTSRPPVQDPRSAPPPSRSRRRHPPPRQPAPGPARRPTANRRPPCWAGGQRPNHGWPLRALGHVSEQDGGAHGQGVRWEEPCCRRRERFGEGGGAVSVRTAQGRSLSPAGRPGWSARCGGCDWWRWGLKVGVEPQFPGVRILT